MTARLLRFALLAPGVWWLALSFAYLGQEFPRDLEIILFPYASGMFAAGAGLWSRRPALRRMAVFASLPGLGLGALGGFYSGMLYARGQPVARSLTVRTLWEAAALSALCLAPAVYACLSKFEGVEEPADSAKQVAAKAAALAVALAFLFEIRFMLANRADTRASWKRQGEVNYKVYRDDLERRGLRPPARYSFAPVLLADPGQCPIKLDSLSRPSATAGEEVELRGQWGQTQGDKLPALFKTIYVQPLDVVSWSEDAVRVRVPDGLAPGSYEIVVYCGLPVGSPYSTSRLPFEVAAAGPAAPPGVSLDPSEEISLSCQDGRATPDCLTALLPKSLPGWKFAGRGPIGGHQYEVGADFDSGEVSTLQISIFDTALVGAWVTAQKKAFTGPTETVDHSGPYGEKATSKTTTYAGFPAIEKVYGADGSGVISVLIADRFIVKVEGDRAGGMDGMKAALAQVDLSRLAGLK